MILTAPKTDYVLHPAGVFPAVCVDLIDLGTMESEFHGKRRTVHKIRLVFETLSGSGARQWLARSFNASLHSKSALADFIAKWRGRPVLPGDTVDLTKLLGVSCTLVVGHQAKLDGSGDYASIDAVSRPTQKVLASGEYDPEAARQRLNGNRPQQPAATGAMVPAGAPEPEEDETDEIPF